jgi:hypothetical protein
MTSKLFDFDPITGTKKMWHYDAEKDQATIETIVDASSLVENNKVLYNESKDNWRGEMHLVASIPVELYYKWKNEGKLDDQKFIKTWLNDSDNRFFRTRAGKV